MRALTVSGPHATVVLTVAFTAAKLDSLHYKMAAVGCEVYGEAKRINDSFGRGRQIGSYSYGWSETDKGAPARVKKATKGQLSKWPELAAARETVAAVSNQAYIYTMDLWPYLLWVREDVEVSQ